LKILVQGTLEKSTPARGASSPPVSSDLRPGWDSARKVRESSREPSTMSASVCEVAARVRAADKVSSGSSRGVVVATPWTSVTDKVRSSRGVVVATPWTSVTSNVPSRVGGQSREGGQRGTSWGGGVALASASPQCRVLCLPTWPLVPGRELDILEG